MDNQWIPISIEQKVINTELHYSCMYKQGITVSTALASRVTNSG